MVTKNLDRREAKIVLDNRLGSIKMTAEKMKQSVEVTKTLRKLAEEYKVGPHLLAEYLELAEDTFLSVP